MGIVLFTIFAIEVTSFFSFLTIGFGESFKYTFAFLILNTIVLVRLKSIYAPIRLVVFLTFAILGFELMFSIIDSNISFVAARIVISIQLFIILYSSAKIRRQFLYIAASFNKLNLVLYFFCFLLVLIFDTSITHSVLPFSDQSIFAKTDYLGQIKVKSLLIYTYNFSYSPDFIPLNIGFAPAGTTAEPHLYLIFSIVLMCLHSFYEKINIFYIFLFLTTVITTLSTITFLAILLALLVVLIAQMIKSRIILLSFIFSSVVFIIYFVASIEIAFIQNLIPVWDRSLQQTILIFFRVLSFENGMGYLSGVPMYQNDYNSIPLSNFLSITLVLLYIWFFYIALMQKLFYVRVCKVTVLIYSIKSLGISIFTPFIFVFMLLFINGKILENK